MEWGAGLGPGLKVFVCSLSTALTISPVNLFSTIVKVRSYTGTSYTDCCFSIFLYSFIQNNFFLSYVIYIIGSELRCTENILTLITQTGLETAGNLKMII